jgi:hypothetical protein
VLGRFIQPDFEPVKLEFDDLMTRFREIHFREAP